MFTEVLPFRNLRSLHVKKLHRDTRELKDNTTWSHILSESVLSNTSKHA